MLAGPTDLLPCTKGQPMWWQLGPARANGHSIESRVIFRILCNDRIAPEFE